MSLKQTLFLNINQLKNKPMKKLLLLSGFLLFAFTQAQAANCEDTLTVGDSIKFDKSSISVPKSCKKFKINLVHNGKMSKTTMGHNVVITATSDVSMVGAKAASAGVKNNYVPKSDKVIAASTLIGSGEKTSVEFDVSKISSGSYSYLCSFPGHWAIMKGKLVIK